MECSETSIFAREADKPLTDEEQRELQKHLLERPESGDLIEKTGAIRKLRFGAGNDGKRGGVRAIYYHRRGRQIISLLVAYPKSHEDDLTDKQKAQLRKLVEKEFK